MRKKGLLKEKYSGIILILATIILFYGLDYLDKYSIIWWVLMIFILIVFILNLLSIYNPEEKVKNKAIWKLRLFLFGEPKHIRKK